MPRVPVKGSAGAGEDPKGSPIYYARRGHGRPLLFVHGSGGDHTLWGAQLQGLKDDFSVSALDLNGHGRSPLREDDDALASYAADTMAVLDELGPQTILAGHSMGGAIAMNIALQCPQQIGALILIGTGAKLRVLPQILEGVQRDFEAAVDLIVQWAFSPSAPEMLREQAREQMRRNGQETLYRDFSSCDRFNVMDRLGEIPFPTLVICGQEDRMTPVKYSEYLRDHIPNAQLEIVEGAGHMVMREAAERVNQVIQAFAFNLSTT